MHSNPITTQVNNISKIQTDRPTCHKKELYNAITLILQFYVVLLCDVHLLGMAQVHYNVLTAAQAAQHPTQFTASINDASKSHHWVFQLQVRVCHLNCKEQLPLVSNDPSSLMWTKQVLFACNRAYMLYCRGFIYTAQGQTEPYCASLVIFLSQCPFQHCLSNYGGGCITGPARYKPGFTQCS